MPRLRGAGHADPRGAHVPLRGSTGYRVARQPWAVSLARGHFGFIHICLGREAKQLLVEKQFRLGYFLYVIKVQNYVPKSVCMYYSTTGIINVNFNEIGYSFSTKFGADVDHSAPAVENRHK